ncbi:TPA: hypothetical protein I9Z65_001471 [Clostridium perfringens]|nr:hypothetical protein [Clostridium perfringens]HBC2033272.1 hypothetical protein [Clostridium perfringens]HBC2056679.1 hypothetical protein [Clostridium perfringens]HBC2070799.1 hypothetical protein [Clostridium perfringens]
MSKIKVFIVCLLVLLIGFTKVDVNALDSFNTKTTVSSHEVKKGDKVEVLFSFETGTNRNKGLNAFQATLDYDEKIFEEVNQSNFETLGSWQELLYNPVNGQFVAINKSGKLQREEIIKLTLTAKQNISDVKTSIKIKDVIASNGKNDMKLNDSEVQIDIVSDKELSSGVDTSTNDTIQNENNANNTSSNDKGNADSINNISSNDKGNADSTNDISSNDKGNTDSTNDISSNNIENVGSTNNDSINNEIEDKSTLNDQENYKTNTMENDLEDNIDYKKGNIKPIVLGSLTILEILILIIIIIIIKKKLEDENGQLSKKGKVILGVIIVTVILSQVFIITKAVGRKGELNGDGEINYKDVSILQQHLIDLKQLPDELLDNGDINSDGKITVTDLSLLVQKIEKSLIYNVEIKSSMENYYINKNEEIDLKFSANVSYGAVIDEVTINDKVYKVEKVIDTDEYYVKLNVGDESGIKEFKFTKVKLDVGKEVKVDFIEKLEVLKEQPIIENYKISDLVEEAKMKVSFDLKDTDSAVKSSKIEVVEKDTSEVIQEEKVLVGKNEFIVNLEEEKDYILNIYVNYDLDTNELTEHEKDNSGSMIQTYDLKLNIDYKFEFNNLKTFNSDGEETSTFNKNQQINIKFNSENATKYQPKSIKVNDKNYELSKNQNAYTATLNGIGNTGEHEIKIQEVVLENGKVFNLKEGNVVKVHINKEKPEVQDVSIQELDDKLAFDISFKIKDTDASISRKNIIIKNDKDEVIFDREFEELEFKEICEVENKLSSKYKVEIKVDYDLTTNNSQPLKDQVIYTKTLESKPRLNVLESKVSATTAEKGEEININYTIESNQNAVIKQLVVNDILAIAKKKADNIYEVTIPAGNKSGVNELKLTKVVFENGVEIKTNKTDSIEILKSIPIVNDYNIEEDYDNEKIRFNFNIKDSDNAFVSGKVQLVKKDGSEKQEENIEAVGKNNFELSVKEDEEYTFKVILTYKRDESGSMLVEEKLFLEKPIQMIREYNLQVSDIKTSNTKETQYFNKNEKIKVTFTSTNETKFIPEKVQINGEDYNLTEIEENKYETTINGFKNPGVSNIKIEKVWMNNNKELNVDKNNTVRVEILKEPPTVESFTYEETEDDKLKVIFKIKDNEEAFKKGKLIVKDKNDEVFSTEEIKTGENQFIFNTSLSEEYIAELFLDYDLDTNSLSEGENEYNGQKVLEKNITVAKELVELKDIESVNLYRKNGNSIEEVNEVDIQRFNPQEYIAKVKMKNIPTLYTEIKEGKVVGREFRLVLNYNNAIQYEGSKKRNEIEVKFGNIDNNMAANIGFDELIKRIQENPTATINLTSDLDASSLNVTTETYLGDFKGTINGNGHTIKNLSKPLFNKLQNAKIENLAIENAKLSGNSRGILANRAVSSIISDVHINNSSIETWNNSGTGGFIGSAEDKTKIQECSANNIFVQSNKVVGGFVGYFMRDSIIDNSYIKGKIKAGNDAIGGIIGQTSGVVTLQNSYADITLDMTVDWEVGGLIGYSDRSNVILKNNISLATGNKGKRVKGSGTTYNKQSQNNYEIEESDLGSNVDGNRVKVISKNKVNEDFLKGTLKWDSEVWNLTGATGDNMPVLKNELNQNNQKPSVKPENDNVYIPNFERISQLEGYDSNREIAYHNMHILMPFYDSKLYIEYGNKIGENDLLNKLRIESVIAYNQDSKMISGLNSQNYDSIKKIKVIFEDQQVKEYNVIFKRMLNDIATYKIDSLDIGYTYNKFVLNTDISLIDEIINKAESMDYNNDIATVTAEQESRLYVDYYNESVKNKINEVVIGILQNEDDYNLYLDNEILKDKIRNELFTNKQLEKLIYTYNYYEKWYKIDIGGIRVSDLLYFNIESILDKKYDIKKLTENMMSIRQDYRATNNTVNFYNSSIKPQTDKPLKEFLEYCMRIEGFSNPDDWFSSNFKGILNEKSVVGKEDEIQYRAWTLLNKRNNHLLPILTAPQEDMYIISVPTQLVIGSLNRYPEHLNGNIEGMKKLIEGYASMIDNFYSTSSSFIENSTDILNSKTHIQYDTRFNFPGIGNQNKGTTQDSVIKWVYEAVDRFAARNGSAAYANGTDVFWVANTALGGNYSFSVFTHETAHNQDGYYFYERKGRRGGTGAEDHADANIAQDLGDGSFVFNIRNDFNIEDDTSNNITLDRINGKEKIHSYYKEMFETYYVLDYLTAKALLQLTPEQQSKLITQANYVDDNNPEDGGQTTNYTTLTAEQIRAMNLKTIEDLWNNRIVFRAPGVVTGNPPGSYGGDNHYNIYWYQPHNDIGRPDSYSFKRLGFELLGVGGYTNGYVAYRSSMSKNDLEALRIATDNPDITWKQYKMDRFNNVENNLNKIPYFNTDNAIKLYKDALIKDSAAGNRNQTNNVRRVLYGIVKRATGDFTHSTVYEMKEFTSITSAQQLIDAIKNNQMGNYKLSADIDFTDIDVSQADAYIPTTFLGTIDGNGHKIKGLTKPLFKKITYANIKNIIIENPAYVSDTKASVILEAKNSMIEELSIINANINRPIVGTIKGSLQMSGDIQNNVMSNEISTIDELLKINENITGLEKKMKYKLTADIDASSLTDRDFIISGEFLGEIDGNGKKIYNLKAPLFQNLKGKVYNLKIEDASIGYWNRSTIGALAGEANNAVIENIKLNNIAVEGRDNVASLVGFSKNTKVNRISASNVNITGHHFYAGGLIGRSFDNKVSDIMIQGKLNIVDTHNGGLIGAINRDTIERAYVNVDVTRTREGDWRNKNAGLYGAIERGPIAVKDVVVIGNVSDTLYKIAPAVTDVEINDIAKYISNTYEYSLSKGISNILDSNSIKSVDDNKLRDSSFYTDELGWSTEIWDFSQVNLGGGPQIK